MPDPNEPNQPGRYEVPAKPRNYDDVAMQQLNQAADEKDRNQAEGRKLEADKAAKAQADREAAGKRADALEKPGPAERMTGNGLQNTQERVASVTPPDPKLTAAQQEMKARREDARNQDRKIAAGEIQPEKSQEQTRSAGDRSR